MPILELAMPTPLRRSFDYLPPKDMANNINQLQPGIRVLAPFGGRKLVGILLAVKESSELPEIQLKAAEKLLDPVPVLSAELLTLGQWAASYYQHPLGDVLSHFLPALLRKGHDIITPQETRWRLSTEGKGLPENALKRAPKQAQLLSLLQNSPSIGESELKETKLTRAVIRSLEEKNLIEPFAAEMEMPGSESATEPPLHLNQEQARAVNHIKSFSHYQCCLLEGVTGSGKTEVYLQLISRCLEQGRQALVLVPEIGLTPQTISRFQKRFNCLLAVLHSGLNDRERSIAWQQARTGKAKIIIGTRSAVFTPMDKPGLIIVDEEHDCSFKQQEGFRYCARDIAIKRAHDQQLPIILGSATPSLESLHNALQQRYQLLQLNQRATGAPPPSYRILDIRHAPLTEGFSEEMLAAIAGEIHQGHQVLVFINRRGFSPALLCHDCGWVGQCHHCDARLTVHFKQQLLRCHHCEAQQPLPSHCPDCNSRQLDFRGPGTERCEMTLKHLFPNTPVIRIDRDTTSRKSAMHDLMEQVNRGDPCVLVGTQMLAKGHHFANITLVAILDADSGLFSADFRGPERMGQLLVQVAGRSGRESKPGKVLIQTHQPEHPLLNSLITQSYHHFARQLLNERQQSSLPPYTYMALIRTDAKELPQAELFLRDIRRQLEQTRQPCSVLGPLPAPMTKKAGRFRAHLLLQSKSRRDLNQALQQLCKLGDQHTLGKRLHWSIDVDPIDLF